MSAAVRGGAWRRPLLLLLLGACAPVVGVHAAPVASVDILRFTYTPRELAVAPGTTVTWTNRDETPHTITSADHRLASPGLDTGEQFNFTFTAAGDYTYACALHPFMTGVVHVRER